MTHYPDGQPTAAQTHRRGTRTPQARTWSPEALTGPSIGHWVAPPGKPGGMVRKLWHRQQADKARAAAVRKREQEDRKLRVLLAAHRVEKKAEAAKKRRIAAYTTSVLAKPTTGRRSPTTGRAGAPVNARSMADFRDLMRRHGLRDESDLYNHLAGRGMTHQEMEHHYPFLFRDPAAGAGVRAR
jgi:hypothetical protein